MIADIIKALENYKIVISEIPHSRTVVEDSYLGRSKIQMWNTYTISIEKKVNE